MAYCPDCGKEIPEGQEKCSLCSQHPAHISDKVLAHINLLTKRINSDPSNIQLRRDLGDLYNKHGLAKEALQQYQEIAKVNAKDLHAQNSSAFIYLRLRELNKAEQAFLAALHIDPKSTEALVGLFRTYYLHGKTDEAIALGNKLVGMKPSNVEFHMLLKNLYAQKGDGEKRLQELLTLEKLIPDNSDVIKEIAEHYKSSDSFDKVIEYYCKMEERKLDDTDLGFTIGVHYFTTGKFEDAIVHFSNMLKNPDVGPEMDIKIQAYLALAYYRKGDITDARNICVEIQPLHAAAVDGNLRKQLAALFYDLGQSALKNKESKEAKHLFEKAQCYDNETEHYAQALKTMKQETIAKYTNIAKKGGLITGAVLGVCILIALIWISIRNRVIMHIEPADNITVLINGDSVGTADDTSGIVRSPVYFMGKHDVVITRPGYETWTGTATIGFARPARIEIHLTPIYYTLSLASVPESASVIIDGKVMGVTPFVSDKIPACPHSIELHLPGYAPWRTNLLLTARDSIDLDTVHLTNLAGKWTGEIGSSSFAYNASFTITIEQSTDILTIKYFHQPREECRYSGTLKGKVENNAFHATGKVTYKYYKVFYWAEEKRQIVMNGTISNSWDRIEGSHTIESFAPEQWWAQHQ
ncbi:PEGA domain-containing protein [candidate division WOR-3 bacterium]|nr:PEGA domain-containing protein [candidate division WOR-3 bacterium]